MANSFDIDQEEGSDEISIIEGFICPLCMCRFKTEKTLLIHFEQSHQDETSTKLGTAIKGIFGKARKIFDFETESKVQNHLQTGKSADQSQECGPKTSHWSKYKSRRECRIESCVVETNKLLIRLDKLLRDAPPNPDRRKEYEKNVVDWIDDEFVKLCPQCAKGFNLSRRKHHCRLCGGILCHDCSLFLNHIYSRQLVGPLDLETSQISMSALSSLTRHASIISLPSTPSMSELLIRVCKDCKSLLDRRNQQMKLQASRPVICELYDHLRKYIKESDNLIKQYYQLYQSIREGEGDYNIKKEHSDEIKSKISLLAENIDAASRRIISPEAGLEPETIQSHKQLQIRIRNATTNYLKEEICTLPPVPTKEEVDEMMEEKIKALKQLQEDEIRLMRQVETVATDEVGWTPELTSKSQDIDDIDPMKVQIEQIKHFIVLAKKDNMYEEAGILEANLKELELEYMVQRLSHNN